MIDQRMYWEKEWNSESLDAYQNYLLGHIHAKPWFLEEFHRRGVSSVCDAACGFGAYSAMLSANGFSVSGFDVSQTAVNLTTELLKQNNLPFETYRTCDICCIDFPDASFDAVVAHAVLDHLPTKGIPTAISELCRITKNNGLIYLSFDPLEPDDLEEPHEVMSDGSFLYVGGGRDGLLFHYYYEEEIQFLLQDRTILQWRENSSGERQLLIQR
jgi:SAM-dependent methyltransferase